MTQGRLSIVGLTVAFGDRTALRDVSLVVPPRAITAVLGPSVSGKTTWLRAVNRLDDGVVGMVRTGEVRLGDEAITAPGTDVAGLRRRVGMVFQRWNPFPRSVFENVAYGPRLAGLRDLADLRGVVESSLRKAALWQEVRDRLDADSRTLSGGQQQRLCIARALANAPEVLLLDEPCSALDPGATRRIEELLFELRADLTIILVTHNLPQAARASDYTAYLDAGRLVEVAPTRLLFTNPQDPRTEDYLTGRVA
ncbi:MAG: phosphate ABC transporter ATP-binding protein [Gemmatimonadota bacterium]